MYAVMLQAYASVRTIGQLYAAGVCSVVFYAICETGADGLLVQLCGSDPRRAMRLQASGMLVRSDGSFVATALSIPLLAVVSPRACISAAGAFLLAAAAAAAFVPEELVGEGGTPLSGGGGLGGSLGIAGLARWCWSAHVHCWSSSLSSPAYIFSSGYQSSTLHSQTLT